MAVATGGRSAVLSLVLALVCSAASAQEVHWSSFEEALSAVEATSRPAVVYVRAPWCGPCYRLERDVLPAVSEELSTFSAAVKIDLADREVGLGIAAFPHEWLRSRGLETPPALAVVHPDGEARMLRGYVPVSELRAWLAANLDERQR